jgi:phosphoglycerate kinase
VKLRTLGNDVAVRGKRVLVRIDGNVPVVRGKPADGKHGRIAKAAVGIDWLRQRGAKVIVITHLGRPNGRRVASLSVKPIAKRLSELLGVTVKLSKDIVGPAAVRMVSHLKDGEVLMLENVRFDPREEKNSKPFAKALASLGDLYVDDAFAVAHRAHASVDAIASLLPSYAGPLLAQEVAVLGKVLKNPRHPVVLAMGGLKMEDKLPVMSHLLPHTDRVLVGGALATAFLAAEGLNVGRSVYDKEGVRAAKRLLKDWRAKLILPADVVVAGSFKSRADRRRAVAVSDIGPKDVIVDIGPRSIRTCADEIHRAHTVIWNGPFGFTEREPFREATLKLARAIAHRSDHATTVVGGGDTIPLLEESGLADRFTLLSTGGGAMLDFLAGKKLPGIIALES